MTLSVKCYRMIDDGHGTKTVYGGSKALIKIESGQQGLLLAHFVDTGPENNPLHYVSASQPPDSGCHHQIVGIVDFALMVPASGLSGKRQPVLPSSKLDLEEPFRN